MKTWPRIVLWSSVPVIGVIGELGYVRAGLDPQLIILDASVFRSRMRSSAARGFIAKQDLSGSALADLIGGPP